ncbi:NADPH-dependent FMN reductase [Chitinophaga sancti]|uniref:NAD(P)H-dependent FMN reductase n=1 Tax=Chitinophaga sancti TaxID=1004 RepID=A0A1K1NAZ6_9BACT|nr:NADPH-dependent FMN reductase [Chitinophaga sancti]WQD63384.1 NADPH-dependent FMN reductase [Chitinophaga sancti]WQG90990.1 NADPH-dependent FMN reductase [Chitinophaga sancti]SFW32610.1 NAD(P)H-dependent FMN reductase [Chitinophaga sancti]
MKKILCISGSLRPTSTNTNILKAIPHLAEWPDLSFSIYEGLDQLPYFSPELDYEGSTPAATVADLRAQLKAADAVIVCTPEYAFGVPGVLKNALDWIVSSGEFVDKPTAVISASPMATGGDKANASLVQTLKVMTATITEDRILIIPTVRTKIDAVGNVTDEGLKTALVKIVESLKTAFLHPGNN